MTLIKSSIYVVNGKPARFTGEVRVIPHELGDAPTPIFSLHGEEIIGGKIEKATLADREVYFGKKLSR